MNEYETLIELIAKVTKHEEIEFLIVGAYARNIFISDNPDIPMPRTTIDIDIACRVSSWADYDKLFKILKEQYHFIQDLKYKHRLINPENIPLDIIPFGEVENDRGEISWPPDFEVTMLVSGFSTALRSALTYQIGQVKIKVITPPLFAFLKLVSWTADHSRTKDLIDFHFVAENYLDIIDSDFRIYSTNGPDKDILEQDDFDVIVAGAELIGRDCRGIDASLSKKLSSIIKNSNQEDELTFALSKTVNYPPDLCERILKGLYRGIDRVSASSCL